MSEPAYLPTSSQRGQCQESKLRILHSFASGAETGKISQRSEVERLLDMADVRRLHELSARLWRHFTVEALLREILQAAADLMGTDKGNIQIFDEKEGVLRILVHLGFSEEFLERFKSVPAGYSVCGTAMEDRQQVIVENALTDPRFSQLAPVYEKFGFVAVQSTPLISSDGRFLGMMSNHFASPRRPDERELRLLSLFAQQAAWVIERKQAEDVLARRAREQSVLFQFTDQLHRATGFKEIYESALNAILSALECQRASILLADPEGVMRFVGWRGLSGPYRKAVEGHSPWDRDVKDPQPVCVSNIEQAELSSSLKAIVTGEGIHALAFIPLMANGQLIGKFMTYYDQPHEFATDEIELSLTIARQLSFAIERKRAESELRASEQRLQLALDAGRMGAWEWNIHNGRLSWSPGLQHIHGLQPGEFSGTFEDFKRDIHPDDLGTVLERIQCALKTGQDYHVIYRMRHPDGAIRWLEAFGKIQKNAEGAAEKMAGVCTDVTDRVQTENALRASEEHLRAVIENTPECVKLVARDGTLLEMNSAGCALVGAKCASDIIGKNIYDVIAPEDRERFRGLNERVCAGRKENLEFQIVTRDGTRRWMETHAAPIPGEEPGTFLHLAVTVDVTGRKEAEDALRQSESLFRELANAMPQIVWAALPDGKLDYYNQRWYELVDGRKDVLGDESWLNVLHPDDRERCLNLWYKSVKEGQPYEIQYRFRYAETGEYRWHLGRALPIRDESGKIIRWFGTCTDIDDQKRAEERLEKRVAQRTRQLREMVAELEAFSYSIAHDMRAPLRAMNGYSRLLQEDHGQHLPEEGLDFVRRIASSAERLDRLIQDVLDYSKISRGEMTLENIDVEKLIREIIETYPHLRDNGAAFLVQSPMPRLIGNPAALTQCISNLLANAVKFVAPETKPRVRAWAETRGQFVRLYIEDNGIGISPEGQKRIFQMFERLNPADKFEGTGIGLTIVRKAVERMGGQIGLESQLHVGSRFWIELERAR